MNDEHTEPAAPGPQPQTWSGVRTGPLQEGGSGSPSPTPKGKRKSLLLQSGHTYHTTKGGVPHDEMIGGPDGNTVITAGGMGGLLVLRPPAVGLHRDDAARRRDHLPEGSRTDRAGRRHLSRGARCSRRASVRAG